ncbi:hypothetical protein EON79_09910 [bacterium]|nr:MAG: hypothetical protein EON79_09910 [bacterium]
MSGAKRAYDLMRGYVGDTWERIQESDRTRAETELSQEILPTTPKRWTPPAPSPIDPVRARDYLGVKDDASPAEIRRAFEALDSRSDPGRFPANSEDARKAQEIQDRVRWAYGILSARFGHLESRFGGLEID